MATKVPFSRLTAKQAKTWLTQNITYKVVSIDDICSNLHKRSSDSCSIQQQSEYFENRLKTHIFHTVRKGDKFELLYGDAIYRFAKLNHVKSVRIAVFSEDEIEKNRDLLDQENSNRNEVLMTHEDILILNLFENLGKGYAEFNAIKKTIDHLYKVNYPQVLIAELVRTVLFEYSYLLTPEQANKLTMAVEAVKTD